MTIKILNLKNSMYVGEVVNGLPEGRGVEIVNDGTLYGGSWLYGLHRGEGIKIFFNGSVYFGEWRNGYEHGHGLLMHPDLSKYGGLWQYGDLDLYHLDEQITHHEDVCTSEFLESQPYKAILKILENRRNSQKKWH